MGETRKLRFGTLRRGMNNAVNTNLKEGTDVLTEIAIVALEITCAA